MAQRNFDYPAELACPHDGWYNGNPKLMIDNGTYADYRFRLEEWVRKGKLKKEELAALDKQWAAIPLAEKKKRRGDVLEAIKKVPVKQRDGKVEYVSKPSDNGRSTRADRTPQLRKKLTHRQPLGSLDLRPDPLDAEAAMQMGGEPDNQLGQAVPEAPPAKLVPTPPPSLANAVV